MHTYATVQEFARFNMVTFYTLKREDTALSEMEDFLARMDREPAYKDQLEYLVNWLELIGNNKKGAIFDLFRQERNCVALPPKGRYLDGAIDLRLYCHYVSENIVILYNGGIKTTHTAQDCLNVSSHFFNAQSWTKQLIEIGIETNGPVITNIEELYIKY